MQMALQMLCGLAGRKGDQGVLFCRAPMWSAFGCQCHSLDLRAEMQCHLFYELESSAYGRGEGVCLRSSIFNVNFITLSL